MRAVEGHHIRIRLAPACESIASDHARFSGLDVHCSDHPLSILFSMKHNAAAIGYPLLTCDTMRVLDIDLLRQLSLVTSDTIVDANISMMPIQSLRGEK